MSSTKSLSHNYSSCLEASEDNNLNELIKLHKQGHELKFTNLTNAVKHDNVEMLDYLLKNNCPIDQALTIKIAKHNSMQILHYLINNHLISANDENDTQVSWHPDTTDYVVKYSKGDLTLLKYYIDNGCPLSDHITLYATEGGYLDCLKYVVEKGAYKHPDTIIYAIKHNQKECFHYLIEQKFVIIHEISIYAAHYGRIELLKYLIDVCKVELYLSSSNYAAESGNIETLMYCLKNGCSNHISIIYNLRKLDNTRLKLDCNNIELRSFVFDLYDCHPELRTSYFGIRIKEEMDTLEQKKKTIHDCISKYVCDDVIQYCIFNLL